MIEEYNDMSCLTYGIHKYKALKKVDANYLLRLYRNGCNGDKALLKYIKDNYEAIEARIGKDPEQESPSCTKKAYISKQAANAHIRWIQENSKSNYVPVRSYQCDKCTSWHITSEEISLI